MHTASLHRMRRAAYYLTWMQETSSRQQPTVMPSTHTHHRFSCPVSRKMQGRWLQFFMSCPAKTTIVSPKMGWRKALPHTPKKWNVWTEAVVSKEILYWKTNGKPIWAKYQIKFQVCRHPFPKTRLGQRVRIWCLEFNGRTAMDGHSDTLILIYYLYLSIIWYI